MASAKSTFQAEDFSRFLIREFLKKSGFDKTYDIFMIEDTRPKVTMTKSELTSLLGMDALVRHNNKTKTFQTMLDIIANYLSNMKAAQGGITVPSQTLITAPASTASKSVNRSSNIVTETTQASTSSFQAQQNQAKPTAQNRQTTQGGIGQMTFQNNRQPPQTADPYSSKPAPIGAPKTSQNFFSGPGAVKTGGGQISQNSLFGGDSTSQPVPTKNALNKNNFTNVVADDEDDDDWDKIDSPHKAVNQGSKDVGFFNRVPVASQQKSQPPVQAKTNAVNNRQVPSQNQPSPQKQKIQNQGYMKSIPTREDALDDFDDNSAEADQNWAQKKGPNPMLRQQYNAMRPQTSGKPGQRGFHGIGKPQAQASGTAQADELDDMLDGMGFDQEQDPLKALNQKKVSGQKKKQQKPEVVEEEDNDGLGFLKKAAEEQKNNEKRRTQAAQEAVESYKTLAQMTYNLDGYQPPERDSYQQSSILGGQVSNLTPQENQGIKMLLFRNEHGSFHPSWAQGFYFDQKISYAIFQNKGGPCGILATVQAFFLKHLLFVQKQSLHNMNLQVRNFLIASAITDILINAASGNPSGDVHIVLPQNKSGAGGRSGATPLQPSQCQKQQIQRGPDQRKRVLAGIIANITSFVSEQGCGVVCLVYSVLLTKGIEQMEADFDFEITLINEYGYASQELINTMLVGRASSNVHDGDKQMGDDLVLKGIHRQSEVGFLTFFEHFGHFEVGQNLKKPVLPIWIVCSESHYSILFSTNLSLASQNITANSRPFDLIYYDELARQQDDVILTVEPGKYVSGSKLGKDGRQHKEQTIPIDSVIRTKWPLAKINWNGRTVIL